MAEPRRYDLAKAPNKQLGEQQVQDDLFGAWFSMSVGKDNASTAKMSLSIEQGWA